MAVEGVPSTQKAWQYAEYGGIDALQLIEGAPVPSLAPDQVLIKVAAAALNPVDYKRRDGLFGKIGTQDSPLPTTPGYDGAGTVVAVGTEVKSFKVGDSVYSNVSEHAISNPKQYGTLAQYTAVEERLVALKPSTLTFEQAAGVPLAALTAQEAFDRAGLKEGQSVLVLAGAGGVGVFAIQLAKKVFKAGFVAATASAAKAPLLKELGADLAIDYHSENFWEREERYDVVLDGVGDAEHAVQVLKPDGKAELIIGSVPEGKPAELFVVTSRGPKLAELTPFFESGDIKSVLDPAGPFPFDKVPEAFAHLETGRATGKIVIAPIG